MKWLCGRCGARWTVRDDRPCSDCVRGDLMSMALIAALALVLIVALLWTWGAI